MICGRWCWMIETDDGGGCDDDDFFSEGVVDTL